MKTFKYDDKFLKFARLFSKRYAKVRPNTTFKDANYTILLKEKLIGMDGKQLTTEARVGHTSGNKELDQTLLIEYNSKHFCYFLILWCAAKRSLTMIDKEADTAALKQYLSEKRPPQELMVNLIVLLSGANIQHNIERVKNIFKIIKKSYER